MITSHQIHWLAGLYEGEGTFIYAKSGSPRLQIKMTDEDIIVKARSLVRPGAKIFVKVHNNSKHKTSYAFSVHGMLAISWMMTLYSLMGRRRKESIRIVLEKWKASERRQKGADVCIKGHPLLIVGVDYSLSENKGGSYSKVCKLCTKEYNKQYKEGYDRPSRAFNAVKEFAKLSGMTLEEAKIYLDDARSKRTIQ